MTSLKRAPVGLAALVVAIVLGCNADEASAPGTSYPPLAAVSELRIDGYGRDLLPIRQIVVGPAEEILVAQRQELTVRVFDADGAEVATFGGQGGGPGEFSTIYSMGFIRDSLWVYDSQGGRLSFYGDGYELARTERVERATVRPSRLARGSEAIEFRGGILQGLLPDGSQHVRLSRPTVPPGSNFDTTLVTYANVDPDGNVRAVIARYAEGRSRFTARGDSWTLSATSPFSMVPLYDVAPGSVRFGLVSVPVEGERVGTVEVTLWNTAGDTVYARRYPIETEPIPAAVADSAVDAMVSQFNEMIVGDMAGEAVRDLMWTPSFYPPVEDFVIGRDGSVWLGLRSLSDSVSVYRVLDPSGEPYGEVRFPDAVDVEVADLRTVWGVVADEYDVESVVRYGISRAP